MIKLIREHLSTKIFIITVCLLITVGSAIYGMVALGMSRSYFLELDRSLSNQTEKMVLQFIEYFSAGNRWNIKNVCIGAWDFYCLKR